LSKAIQGKEGSADVNRCVRGGVTKESNSRLVYSTEHAVPRKEKRADRTHATVAAPAKKKPIVRLDRKGRGGKAVTVIEGLQLSVEDGETLLKQLKAKLGAGGTAKNGALEIQGDHCDAVMEELSGKGFLPKRSGG
jgi:translation initiation factor 1